MRPVLYFDLGSPYTYLALERAAQVLGGAPELEPILLGAFFSRRGYGSWAHGPEHAQRRADIEQRARRAGLPAMTWPVAWPTNGLAAMRAATWAKLEHRAEPFARAVARAQFARGADIADLELLAQCAAEAGLDPLAMPAAIASEPIKLALRAATEMAWQAGVRGVPSVRIGTRIFFGDDQLEIAAGSQ